MRYTLGRLGSKAASSSPLQLRSKTKALAFTFSSVARHQGRLLSLSLSAAPVASWQGRSARTPLAAPAATQSQMATTSAATPANAELTAEVDSLKAQMAALEVSAPVFAATRSNAQPDASDLIHAWSLLRSL